VAAVSRSLVAPAWNHRANVSAREQPANRGVAVAPVTDERVRADARAPTGDAPNVSPLE
jgi:hypothetical protein